MKSFFRELIPYLIIFVVVFVGVRTLSQQYIVDGDSMLNNFHNRQRLLVSKQAFLFQSPQRGEVIIFQPPFNRAPGDDEPFIKRIIGIPGDIVEIKKGVVYINGQPIEEPYITNKSSDNFSAYTVPEGKYFVLGDNRINSHDSRYGWVVPRKNIIGQPWLSIWPASEWGIVRAYPIAEQLANN